MLNNLSFVGWSFFLVHNQLARSRATQQKHQCEIYFIDSNCLANAIYWLCFQLFKRCNCKICTVRQTINALHRSLNKQIAEISLFYHENRIGNGFLFCYCCCCCRWIFTGKRTFSYRETLTISFSIMFSVVLGMTRYLFGVMFFFVFSYHLQ